MENWAALMFLTGFAVVVAGAAVVTILRSRARRRTAALAPHDDLLRAGATDGTSPGEAGSRAVGSNAWMRPDGGGF